MRSCRRQLFIVVQANLKPHEGKQLFDMENHSCSSHITGSDHSFSRAGCWFLKPSGNSGVNFRCASQGLPPSLHMPGAFRVVTLPIYGKLPSRIQMSGLPRTGRLVSRKGCECLGLSKIHSSSSPQEGSSGLSLASDLGSRLHQTSLNESHTVHFNTDVAPTPDNNI